MAARASASKRPRAATFVVGATVEATTPLQAGFDKLKVTQHRKLEPSDTHYTAQASYAKRTMTVSVVDQTVTEILPHKGYTARRYGTVAQVKELEGGRLYYWVVWDHGPTTAAKREAAEEDPSLRVVSKRPPWVPTPDRARWPTEVQERSRGVE